MPRGLQFAGNPGFLLLCPEIAYSTMSRPRKQEQPSQFIDPHPVVAPDTVKATIGEVLSRKDAANKRREAKAAGTWVKR